jgi:galactokinase
MYRIKTGSTSGFADTDSFIDLLNSLSRHLPEETRGFFSPGELIVTRVPGRIDLMGGIADYSGSLVLQLPIASATHVALQLSDDLSVRILSLPNGSEEQLRQYEVSLQVFLDRGQPISYAATAEKFAREEKNHWAAYVAGAFLVLMRERDCVFKRGPHILISSSVPEGKGVSSSAALEVAVMQAVAKAYEIEIEPGELAFLCQKVENLIAGAPCGVMDQMTAACGEADRLLVLLCQPGEVKGTIGLPGGLADGLAVWGIDSGIRHSVGGADYGTVRTAAFMGYRMIAERAGLTWRKTEQPGLIEIEDPKWNGYLANIEPGDFERLYAEHLPQEMRGEDFLRDYQGITDKVVTVESGRSYPVRQATRHPIQENARVRPFADVLESWKSIDQAEVLGALMYESHQSYSDCGLGSSGTDLIVDLVREAGVGAGLYGARITGGGSGGTVAVLANRDALPSIEAIADLYAQRTGHRPLVISGSSAGAGAFGWLRLVRD